MKRIEKFLKLKTEIWWAPKIANLKPSEVSMIEKFIELNEALDYNEFTALANRMFLSAHGWPVTKNSGTIQEILSCLAKTKINFYGYNGTERWVHPSDRDKFGGKEWRIVDETDVESAAGGRVTERNSDGEENE